MADINFFMTNQELIDFIKRSKVTGQTDEQIKSSLLTVGWQDADINEILNKPKRGNRIRLYQYVLLSGIVILISLAGIIFFLNSHDSKEPILEFKENFKTADYIDKDLSSLVLDLDKQTVRLPFNAAKDISAFINNLSDFRRIKTIGTDGNKFLVAAESSYQAGSYPLILEYSHGEWKDLSAALKTEMNTRNLNINVIGWGQDYWLIGGSVANEDANGYALIKHKDGQFTNLTKLLPPGDYGLNINSLSYAPQIGWLIGAWRYNGSFILKYDGEKKFDLILDSEKQIQDVNKNFQVQALDNDGKDFVIGGTRSTVLLYHDNVLSDAYASAKYVLGNEFGVITSVRFDKNSKNYSKWILTTADGPVLEFDLSLLKKAAGVYENFQTSLYTDMRFKNNDLLVVTDTDAPVGPVSEFIKLKNTQEKVDLSPIIPPAGLNGLRFIAIASDSIIVGNPKNLFEIEKPQLYLNTGSIQSKPVFEQIKWYKTIKKIKLNSDTLEGNNIKFYISTNTGTDWQELPESSVYINEDTGRSLIWKAEFFSEDGDGSPYLNKINISYQLGFSKLFLAILLMAAVVIEAILIFFIYRFLIARGYIKRRVS